MARSIFVSFHYNRDISRVNVVRNSYVAKGTYTDAGYWDHSLWEETKKKGSEAIKALINKGLNGTSVTVILIGAETASRPWVKYEIEKSIERGNGLLGIHICNIKNLEERTDLAGKNPLSNFNVTQNGIKKQAFLVYPSYDWVKSDGYNNFGTWIEAAARIAGK